MANNQAKESGYWTVEGEGIGPAVVVKPTSADRKGQAKVFIATLAAEIFALFVLGQTFEMVKWNLGAAIDILAIALVGSIWTLANSGRAIWDLRPKWPDEISGEKVNGEI